MTAFKRVDYIKEPLTAAPIHATYQFHVMLPEPLASWDVYDYWEKERTYSMRDNLKMGDTLFDIGAEYGWQSAVYAQFVGGENMVLFEPTAEYWPNIKQTFEANHLKAPAACFVGLVSDKTTAHLSDITFFGEYPKAADGELHDGLKYTFLHDDEPHPEVSVDQFVQTSGIVPDALTMDTEGAELIVLKGAEQTLKDHHPLVWASIHPDLAEKHYGTTKQDILDYMADLGYEAEYLATDHEEHWLFK